MLSPEAWVSRANTQQDTQLPSSFMGMDGWTTSQLNLALIRLVHELNVRTVYLPTLSLGLLA